MQVTPRSAHGISRNDISENALKVLYRLHKAGFEAYLVGGGVRDLLLRQQPKDFDIATNATPEQIRKLFRNCRLVGRRFRLAHILFGRDIIEVATLRGHHEANNAKIAKQDDAGRLLRDNVYGSIDEDAERRDFTVNGLYYDISDYSVRDYFGGMADIKAKRLRLIGDPQTRYREDPVRMIRAVRFATKLGFSIDKATAAPIPRMAPMMADIPPARLFEESLKLLMSGKGHDNFQMLRQYGLWEPMFPLQESLLKRDDNGKVMRLFEAMLKNTDDRVNADKPVTPAFLYAALLWYVVEDFANDKLKKGMAPYDAITAASGDAISKQCKTISLPRRFTTPAMEIWQLQGRLDKRSGSRAFKLLEHPRFRAAYDFLLLRAEAEQDDELLELARWWTAFNDANDNGRRQMVRALGNDGNRRRRRRPRRKPAAKPAAKPQD
ncbi:polynucleotide adenylyltransferase PcnB [uncultured Ferrimonas sp.]|uniref:polynucleotide adenylyltransferase PcnB n=1 Tax=uncultured Ferrimonas sp. TaxID=432640 RepID=UPI0034448774